VALEGGGGRVHRAASAIASHWPPLIAAAALLVYAAAILGFGLDFRPLHNDEGVTLQVASLPSAHDVLDWSLQHRHGPPLHYLLVHASLTWRADMLGLRLPSALLGILAVGFAYGFGRELLGRRGGAFVALVVAASPMTVHLAQFARGYTALIAATFLSLWLALVLVRTRDWIWVGPYALSALLLVSAHPFGLFALASELVLLVVLPLAMGGAGRRPRALVSVAVAGIAGLVALLALRDAYAPLQHKYGVGSGGAVADLGSSGFWRPLAEASTGSARPLVAGGLAAAMLLGIAVLALRDRRGAIVAAVWLLLPLAALALLHASSHDFAPERHLSFLLPAYALGIAALLDELARRLRPHILAAVAVAVLAGAMLAPAVLADYDDLGSFTSDLRQASGAIADGFRRGDVLMTTTGENEPNVDARLYGSYVVLAAHAGSPLADWRPLADDQRCTLVRRLGRAVAEPGRARLWLLLRPPDPAAAAVALDRLPRVRTDRFGDFVLAVASPPRQTAAAVIRTGIAVWKATTRASPGVWDFRAATRGYGIALGLAEQGVCPR
jgi:hypothetical protein